MAGGFGDVAQLATLFNLTDCGHFPEINYGKT